MYSLVTACMNRESHLRQTLPEWLKLQSLKEIVIVDWSNVRPLSPLLELDERIRIVRIEDEQRWILSYAYNVGVSHSTQPMIVKCDADCMPRPEIFESVPTADQFFAGNWRSGRLVNKPSVNGQTIFSRSQFNVVNGYSELIRTYGRDDEDFYDRLIAAGFRRGELKPDFLDFVDHTNQERTVNQFAPAAQLSVEQQVVRDILYNEMHNYFVAKRMPWGSARPRSSFETLRREDRLTVLRRKLSDEILIPDEVERAARLLGLQMVAARVAGLSQSSAERLDERACLGLIGLRMRPKGKTLPLQKTA